MISRFVEENCDSNLFELGNADDRVGLPARGGKRGQKNSNQYRDDPDDNKQLDEREGISLWAFRA